MGFLSSVKCKLANAKVSQPNANAMSKICHPQPPTAIPFVETPTKKKNAFKKAAKAFSKIFNGSRKADRASVTTCAAANYNPRPVLSSQISASQPFLQRTSLEIGTGTVQWPSASPLSLAVPLAPGSLSRSSTASARASAVGPLHALEPNKTGPLGGPAPSRLDSRRALLGALLQREEGVGLVFLSMMFVGMDLTAKFASSAVRDLTIARSSSTSKESSATTTDSAKETSTASGTSSSDGSTRSKSALARAITAIILFFDEQGPRTREAIAEWPAMIQATLEARAQEDRATARRFLDNLQEWQLDIEQAASDLAEAHMREVNATLKYLETGIMPELPRQWPSAADFERASPSLYGQNTSSDARNLVEAAFAATTGAPFADAAEATLSGTSAKGSGQDMISNILGAFVPRNREPQPALATLTSEVITTATEMVVKNDEVLISKTTTDTEAIKFNQPAATTAAAAAGTSASSAAKATGSGDGKSSGAPGGADNLISSIMDSVWQKRKDRVQPVTANAASSTQTVTGGNNTGGASSISAAASSAPSAASAASSGAEGGKADNIISNIMDSVWQKRKDRMQFASAGEGNRTEQDLTAALAEAERSAQGLDPILGVGATSQGKNVPEGVLTTPFTVEGQRVEAITTERSDTQGCGQLSPKPVTAGSGSGALAGATAAAAAAAASAASRYASSGSSGTPAGGSQQGGGSPSPQGAATDSGSATQAPGTGKGPFNPFAGLAMLGALILPWFIIKQAGNSGSDATGGGSGGSGRSGDSGGGGSGRGKGNGKGGDADDNGKGWPKWFRLLVVAGLAAAGWIAKDKLVASHRVVMANLLVLLTAAERMLQGQGDFAEWEENVDVGKAGVQTQVGVETFFSDEEDEQYYMLLSQSAHE